MANYVNNIILLKGKKENLLNFLNTGLENSDLPKQNNIREANKLLKEKGITYKADTFNKETGLQDIVVENGVSMSTFRKIDKSFLLYDTTNSKATRASTIWHYNNRNHIPMFDTDEQFERYCKGFDEAIEYQKKTYGYAGWYDANVYHYFGCKWDMGIFSAEIVTETENEVVYRMDIETPWSMPLLWLLWIRDTFDLKVYLCAFEEGDMYNIYGELGDIVDGNDSKITNMDLTTIYDIQDDWEKQFDERERVQDNFISEFISKYI